MTIIERSVKTSKWHEYLQFHEFIASQNEYCQSFLAFPSCRLLYSCIYMCLFASSKNKRCPIIFNEFDKHPTAKTPFNLREFKLENLRHVNDLSNFVHCTHAHTNNSLCESVNVNKAYRHTERKHSTYCVSLWFATYEAHRCSWWHCDFFFQSLSFAHFTRRFIHENIPIFSYDERILFENQTRKLEYVQPDFQRQRSITTERDRERTCRVRFTHVVDGVSTKKN